MAWLQVEIVAAVQRLLAVGGNIGTEMVLIGRLVGREARVAVEAVGAVADGQMGYRGVETGYAPDGLGHALFKVCPHSQVFGLVGKIPLPIVVPGQLA